MRKVKPYSVQIYPTTSRRSTQAAARALNINPKLLYRWQQAQVVAEVGSEVLARDPEMRALRAANKRLAQELEILKKPSPANAISALSRPPRRRYELLRFYRC